MDASLWIAFLALAISVLGPLGYAVVKGCEAREERHETRLRWRRDYLHHAMRELIELRAELQYLQDKGRGSAWEHTEKGGQKLLELEQQREVAYGKAFALMLTIPHSKVRGRAGQVMDQVQNWSQNEKLEAINDAIKALGDLLDQAMGETERVSKL